MSSHSLCNNAIDILERKIKELERKNKEVCIWRESDEGFYETNCGNGYTIITGTPKENGMKYCTYCGKKLQAK